VLSEAVVYKSAEEFSLSSAVKYGVDVADDLGAVNLEDVGRAPGIERMREVALEPVGIPGI
jgi:hypothetical protein